MVDFQDIIRGASSDVAVLTGVIERWPWLITARVLRMNASDADHLRLRLQAWPRPSILLGQCGVRSVERGVEKESCSISGYKLSTPRSTLHTPHLSLHASIEAFLRSEDDHRIVPHPETGDENAAAASEKFDLADGMMTEQLAQIFVAQRLFGQAKAIYEHLSLQNPEKSVYFAGLIARCNKAQKG